MRYTMMLGCLSLFATVAACGGGGGGSGSPSPPPPSPPPPAATFSVALTGVDIDRVADQADIPIDGLPVDGATLTMD